MQHKFRNTLALRHLFRKPVTYYLATKVGVTRSGIHLSGWRFHSGKAPLPEFRIDKFRDPRTQYSYAPKLIDRSLIERIGNRLLFSLFKIRFQRFSADLPVDWAALTPSLYNVYATGGRLRYYKPVTEQLIHPADNRTVIIGCDRKSTVSLRAEVTSLGADTYRNLVAAGSVNPPRNSQPICMIGELTISARDNGFQFYSEIAASPEKYEVSARYVIERDNLDKVLIGSSIIEFGSE
ncbi:MAG: hypothetical protein EOP06_25285, partial [Proteobacteria bacterium]